MPFGLPIGLSFGLGAALMWGLTDVSASLGGRRIGSLRVLAASQAVGFSVLVMIGTLQGLPAQVDGPVIVASILVGFAGTAAYLSFFTALRIGPLSVVSPITAAYGGLTVVLAVIFRGESLTHGQAAGAVLATLGVIMAGLVFDDGFRSARFVGKGVLFAFAALVGFALMTVGSAGPINEAGWLPVMLISRAVNVASSLILLALALSVAGRRLAPLLDAPLVGGRGAWGLAAVAGLLDVTGLVSFGIGLERAETWLVGLASSFGPAVAVLVGVVLLGERLRRTQWLGLLALAMGLGIVAAAG
ncbi:MAG TPA: DMT family transporter [Vitreimonas sp.]|nr:DMT family transporter [Vitreimonas sp.]